MSSAFAQYFPFAIGVAISPMAIIAIVILCIIGKAKAEGSVFVIGWFLSIIGFMVLTVLLGNGAASGAVKDSSILSVIVQFAFTFLLFWLAWRNWISRPRKNEQITEPKWIARLSQMPAPAVLGIAAFFAIVNAKNLPIMTSTAIMIVQADQGWGRGLVDAAIFAAISSLGVFLPWLITLIGGEKMNPLLERMRDWLYKYNNIIMTVLFGFLGVNALGGAVAMLAR